MRASLVGFVAVFVAAAPLTFASSSGAASGEGEVFYISFGPPAVGSHGSYSVTVTEPAAFQLPGASVGVTDGGTYSSIAFSITGSNSAGCSVGSSGASFTYSKVGSCVVSVVAKGDLDHDGDVDTANGTLSVSVQAGKQTIAVTPATGPVGSALPLVATGYSGTGAITFALASGGTAPGCAVSGTQVKSTGAGTCMVTATIAADAAYGAATSAPAAMTFTKLSQTISVPAGSAIVGTPIALAATGYVGTGAITFALASGGTASGCAINSSGQLSATGVGTCVVTATIAADATYTSATSAPSAQTFRSPPPKGSLEVTASSETIDAGTAVNETSSLSGVLSPDVGHLGTVRYTYTGSGSTSYGPSTSPPSNPGTYVVSPSDAELYITPSADASRYSPTILYHSGNLTIRAKLTVTASSASVVAGTSFHPSAQVTGLSSGDNATVDSATYTFTGTAGTTYGPSTSVPTTAGAYTVTPSDATVTVTPGSHQTYYPAPYTYVAGTLVITPVPITIKVNPPPAPAPVPTRTFTIKPFPEGSYALGKKLKAQVLKLANEIKSGGYHSVTLQAYTDNVFTAAFNTVLNQNRAQAVENQLTADLTAIGDHKVTITITAGFSIVLVSQNATAKGRAANRRVVATLKAN